MALINLQKTGTQGSGSVKDKKKAYVPCTQSFLSGNSDGQFYPIYVETNVTSKSLDSISLHRRHFAMQTKGSFAMHDLLLRMMEEFNPEDGIPDLWVTTFSMTELSANVIGKLKVDGKINNLAILMDKESRTRYPQVHQILLNICDDYALTHIHAKVMVLSNTHMSFVVIGSANWTKNPRVEMLFIFKNTFFAEQHIKWITDELNIAYERE